MDLAVKTADALDVRMGKCLMNAIHVDAIDFSTPVQSTCILHRIHVFEGDVRESHHLFALDAVILAFHDLVYWTRPVERHEPESCRGPP